MVDEPKLGTLLRKDDVLFPAIGVTLGFSVFAIMIAGYLGGVAVNLHDFLCRLLRELFEWRAHWNGHAVFQNWDHMEIP